MRRAEHRADPGEKEGRTNMRVWIQGRIWPAAMLCALVLGSASTTFADPCKAIPDRGPAPSYLSAGAAFSGPVVYVGDGDSLCVALGEGPKTWVEVRLADFYAPESNEARGASAKAALARIALGRRAVCRAGHQSYDRMVARCEIGGRSIGDLMRSAGVAEGGRGR